MNDEDIAYVFVTGPSYNVCAGRVLGYYHLENITANKMTARQTTKTTTTLFLTALGIIPLSFHKPR